MRYEGNIRVYDMFDLVQVSATVWQSPRPALDPSDPLLRRAVCIRGTGEEEPQDWLKKALTALF